MPVEKHPDSQCANQIERSLRLSCKAIGMRKVIYLWAALIIANPAIGGVELHPTKVSDQELFAALDLEQPGMEGMQTAVEKHDYEAAANAWAEYFRKREKPTPHFSRQTWPEFIRREFPQLVAPIIAGADKIVRGELSQPPYTMPVERGEIKWLHNPTRDTNYISIVGSPFFLNPLGRAYLLTGDEKYAKAFAWFFESWYDHQDEIIDFQGGLGFNPIYHAYYPGIRSRILVDNYYCLARSLALTPGHHLKLMKQLLGSAAWLYAQEQRYRKGNQQVAAVLGLGIVGMVLPEFKDAEKWITCAEARMKEHLQRDFFADGGHKELCTQYHKACLRDIGYVALTAEANGRPSFFRSDASPLLEHAYQWLARLVMPTGETPALHSAAFSEDYAVHLLIGARYFRRPDFLWLAQRFWQRGVAPTQKRPVAHACFMVCETLASHEMPKIEVTPPDYKSVHLDKSGFAVMRTGWEENDRYLVFQYGWGNSTHAYPGALAFCLEMNGELVATNPGSPLSYRHPAYPYCHSTPSHNVISIDMKSYSRPGQVAPGGKLHTYADLPGAWYVSGHHDGYKKMFGAIHERSILVIKDGPILIRDLIQGGKDLIAQWNFHTPLELTVQDDRIAMLKGRGVYRLCPAFPEEIVSVKTEKRWEAVLPQDCQPADCGKEIPVLRYEKPIGEEGVQFCVALLEGEGKIEALSGCAFRLRAGDSTYVVLYRDTNASVEAEGIATDAECACVRFKGELPERAWVIGGKHLTILGTAWLDSDELQTLELVKPK